MNAERMIGLIGLGQMGIAMAKAFAEAGYSVVAYDVNAVTLNRAVHAGYVAAACSAREVAEATGQVIVAVYSPDDSRSTFLDPRTGVFAGLAKGGLAIDTTTNTRTVVSELGRMSQQREIDFVVAPVSGRAPNLTMMMGGPTGAYERARHLVEPIATRALYMGSGDAACIAKHVNQFMTYANFLVAAQALAAARNSDLSVETLFGVLESSSAASFMLKFAAAEMRGVPPPVVPAPVRLVAKDMRLARDCLESLGLRSGALAEATDAFAAAEEVIGARPFVEVVARLKASLAV